MGPAFPVLQQLSGDRRSWLLISSDTAALKSLPSAPFSACLAMLQRSLAALSATEVAAGVVCRAWRGVASKASEGSGRAAAASSDRPLSADPAVRQAQRQQPSSILEPPLLHDSMSEATYSYHASSRAAAATHRISSITEPDYYLNNSLSEGTYGMPRILQRATVRTQGGAKHGRPTMQRIIVASKAASQNPEPLHDSYSEVDYDSPYKARR